MKNKTDQELQAARATIRRLATTLRVIEYGVQGGSFMSIKTAKVLAAVALFENAQQIERAEDEK